MILSILRTFYHNNNEMFLCVSVSVLWIFIVSQGLEDAELKVPLWKNQAIEGSFFKPGVSQNMPLHASSTSRDFTFLPTFLSSCLF